MEAQRGGIYEFYNPYGERVPGRYALVIAAEDRSLDYFVERTQFRWKYVA